MRIVFMGTPESAVPSLQRLLEDGHEIVSVWTQPDKPAGRGDKMHSPPVKDFALQNNLPLEQPTKIKTVEAKTLFQSYKADVVVVVAYGRILPAEYLAAPRLGPINVHFSLLPKYRGAAPTNWAIVKGETVTGVTTMLIEEELDSGPILLQRETPIGKSETAADLMKRLAVIGAELLSETLNRLGKIKPKYQDHSRVSFAPLLTRADGLIDWEKTASEIECCVRGFQPWPNAYTHFKGKRVIIWKAEEAMTNVTSRPGEVITAHAEEMVVSCGEGTALSLLEVQPEAKRRMSAKDFLNGTHLKTGERFGEE